MSPREANLHHTQHSIEQFQEQEGGQGTLAGLCPVVAWGFRPSGAPTGSHGRACKDMT